MKKILLTILLLAGLTATAQHNFPRYFQQVNRSNTNRFTTGGALSYRWIQLTDSLQNDTVSILPSSYQNVYTVTGSAGSPDSINRNIWIVSNDANAYLNDNIYIYSTVAAGDTIFFNGSIINEGGITTYSKSIWWNNTWNTLLHP